MCGVLSKTLPTVTLGFGVGIFIFIDIYLVGAAVGALVGVPVGNVVEEIQEKHVLGQLALAAKTEHVQY